MTPENAAMYTASGPTKTYLVVTRPDGEKVVIAAQAVVSVHQAGSQCVIWWNQGSVEHSCRVTQSIDAIVQVLCEAQQTPVVNLVALAQDAFGR